MTGSFKIPNYFFNAIKAIREMLLLPVNREMRLYCSGISGDIKNIVFLIATKNGLYILYGGQLYLLLDGEFYGLTRDYCHWYVFQKSRNKGRIIRLNIECNELKSAKVIIDKLSVGCHQIDMIKGVLYVTDTYNNCLLLFKKTNNGFELDEEIYPEDKLLEGRASGNYAHINSVWSDGEYIYLVLHNETSKTGKNSEIIVLNEWHYIERRIVTSASHAHNVLMWMSKLLLCNSMDGELLWGDKVVFKANSFLRGLSVGNQFIIVGGSDYGEKCERNRLNGNVYILSHQYDLLGEMVIPGMVQEIRGVNYKDFSLSENAQAVSRTLEKRTFGACHADLTSLMDL